MKISFTMRFTVPDTVLVQELEGECILLNLQNERYYGLDDVGTRMWTALTTFGSIQEAYDALFAEYNVTPEQLRQDLTRMVEQLMDNGLVCLSKDDSHKSE